MTQTQERPVSPIVAFSRDLEKREDKFRELLPTHISPAKFRSAALTAVQHNPDLLSADKASLFNALQQSCQDGLLPDNREAALVIHNTNTAKKGQPANWVAKVAYMPMVRGVLRKLRQSGEIATITLQVVYHGEEFDFWVDEEGEHLKHRPTFEGDRSDNNIRLAYAMVRLKDGDLQVEILTKAEIEKIKGASKTGAKGFGPWKDWYVQMAKKSALHRLAPKLPISSELVTLIERDREIYDFDQEPRDVTPPKPQQGRSSRLQQFIGDDDSTSEEEREHENA